MAAENVTVFELQCAIRALLRGSEFFSLPKLIDEIEQARARTRRHHKALATDVGETITAIEEQRRRRERERARDLGDWEALDQLRSNGRLCFPICRLPGIGYLDPALLLAALNDDERDRQWATSFYPEQDRMRDALPGGWQPPDDVAEILWGRPQGTTPITLSVTIEAAA